MQRDRDTGGGARSCGERVGMDDLNEASWVVCDAQGEHHHDRDTNIGCLYDPFRDAWALVCDVGLERIDAPSDHSRGEAVAADDKEAIVACVEQDFLFARISQLLGE